MSWGVSVPKIPSRSALRSLGPTRGEAERSFSTAFWASAEIDVDVWWKLWSSDDYSAYFIKYFLQATLAKRLIHESTGNREGYSNLRDWNLLWLALPSPLHCCSSWSCRSSCCRFDIGWGQLYHPVDGNCFICSYFTIVKGRILEFSSPSTSIWPITG